MYHGDEKGLVLPPNAAQIQVVVIPIPFKGKEEIVNEAANKLHKQLKMQLYIQFVKEFRH